MTNLRERLSETYKKLAEVQSDYDNVRAEVLIERRHRLGRKAECPVCLYSSDISMILVPCGHALCSTSFNVLSYGRDGEHNQHETEIGLSFLRKRQLRAIFCLKQCNT